jgi:hypothetical protein
MIGIMLDWQHIFDDAPTKTFVQGAAVFRREDHVHSMYLFDLGTIVLERLADGTVLTLELPPSEWWHWPRHHCSRRPIIAMRLYRMPRLRSCSRRQSERCADGQTQF